MPKLQWKLQAFVPGLGQHYTSPRKAVPRKSQIVQPLGHLVKKQKVAKELARLLSNDKLTDISPHVSDMSRADTEVDELTTQLSGTEMEIDMMSLYIRPFGAHIHSEQTLRISSCPQLHTFRVCCQGHKMRFPDFVAGLLVCATSKPSRYCVYSKICHLDFRTMEVQGCHCETIPQRLIVHSLFPTSPNQPQMAISIDLLNFYHTLFEKSCDAIHAMSHALKKFYTCRGYFLASQHTGDEVKEPFRRSLGYALQWHDSLCVLIDRQVQAAISAADAEARLHLDSDIAAIAITTSPVSDPTRCARELRNRCPACFSRNTFGVLFTDGGDFHVAVDSNFHHRHRRSAGEGCEFHTPEYFLLKEYVDAVGARIDKALPLFTANIDTPGRQQKYAVALIQYLFQQIPNNATVLVLYDVGCVLNWSLQLYEILPSEITERLSFTTSAMYNVVHIPPSHESSEPAAIICSEQWEAKKLMTWLGKQTNDMACLRDLRDKINKPER
ncbi:hypothetical protein BDN71DRAFT_1566077 [Pleurotus eryngii]|uniref:CxC1-like cysteine cluster associated with KDZ transposases domain-containing protein n=1 Tax=Pleurotus eryngii TaxID=5323 RepID=A0A9P5ZTK4_PLEER|nr:hypothetical protein BDN71DRAFT_1566077 [Pleurotus eryngii]